MPGLRIFGTRPKSYLHLVDAQDYIDRARRSKASRKEVMAELYLNTDLRSNCRKFVCSHGGNVEESNTIYVESIVAFTKACSRQDFNIRTTLENYLFGVTQNLWYRTIRERKKNNPTDNLPEIEDTNSPEILLLSAEKSTLLNEILIKLDDKCRQVLIMWAQKIKMKAIAVEMNYSSPEVVRKKKHFCLKKLIELVKNHPGYLDSLKGDI